MYSPRIADDLIPKLYRMAKEKSKPMTKIVDDIIREYVLSIETEDNNKIAFCSSCLKTLDEADEQQNTAYCNSCETIVSVQYRKTG